MAHIKINCSDVASLIGKHPFRSKKEAIDFLLMDNDLVETVIDEDEEMANNLVQECIPLVQACVTTTNEVDYTKAVQNYKTEITKKAKEKGVSETVITKAIRQLNTEVGQQSETQCIDACEKVIQAPISQRNSKCYIYEVPSMPCSVVLAGKIDGMTKYQNQDAVLENKRRMKSTRYNPPEYDIIQLRCYMKLTNTRYGILNESYPDGTSLQTNIEWDESIWNQIINQLRSVIINLVE